MPLVWRQSASRCKSTRTTVAQADVDRPLNMYMVHFRSFDLETLYAQGGFWHLNFMSGSIMINQDEKEIFTFHTMVGPDVEAEDMDAMKTLQAGLGGIGEPCPIKVEQILKTAVWRSSVSVADAFRSTKGRVFLAGDSGTAAPRCCSRLAHRIQRISSRRSEAMA